MLKKITALIAAAMIALAAQTAKADVYGSLLKVLAIEDDVVVLVDGMGYTWEWEDSDDIYVGEYYSAVYDDCGTESIFDDEIINLRYEPIF